MNDRDPTPDLELSQEELGNLFNSAASMLIYNGELSGADDVAPIDGELAPKRFTAKLPPMFLKKVLQDEEDWPYEEAEVSYTTAHNLVGSEPSDDPMGGVIFFKAVSCYMGADPSKEQLKCVTTYLLIQSYSDNHVDATVDTEYVRGANRISPNAVRFEEELTDEYVGKLLDDAGALQRPMGPAERDLLLGALQSISGTSSGTSS